VAISARYDGRRRMDSYITYEIIMDMSVDEVYK